MKEVVFHAGYFPMWAEESPFDSRTVDATDSKQGEMG